MGQLSIGIEVLGHSNSRALLAFLGNGYGNEWLGREPVVGIPVEPGFISLGAHITRFHTSALPFPSLLQETGSPAKVQYIKID
jgi:hypothetical protein